MMSGPMEKVLDKTFKLGGIFAEVSIPHPIHPERERERH